MSEVAQLITAIAALVTAIGGATAAIIVALQSLARQRTAAAEQAARLIGRRGNAEVSGEPRAPHRHRANHRRPSALDAEVRREAEFEDLELTRDLARDARDIARDARELALESQREARFHDLEHRSEHNSAAPAGHPPELPPPATHGDGVDA